MTIKLNYIATIEFSSRDLRDLAEPPLTYKVWRNPSAVWTDAVGKFLDDSQNVGLALEVIGSVLVSVNDGEQTHPIGNVKKAKELQAAVETANPGYGEQYIILLALGIIDKHFELRDQILGDLKKSSTVLSDGPATESLNGKMEQPISSTETT